MTLYLQEEGRLSKLTGQQVNPFHGKAIKNPVFPCKMMNEPAQPKPSSHIVK